MTNFSILDKFFDENFHFKPLPQDLPSTSGLEAKLPVPTIPAKEPEKEKPEKREKEKDKKEKTEKLEKVEKKISENLEKPKNEAKKSPVILPKILPPGEILTPKREKKESTDGSEKGKKNQNF